MDGDEPVVIDLAGLPVVPWRNGAGVTREVLGGPRDEQGEPDWRLSLAAIGGPATYSTFEGIDRASCVVAGGGLRLRVDGRRVDAGPGQVVSYAGESLVEARLVDGPVSNLNVLARRGRASAVMRVRSEDGPVTWPAWTALLLLEGDATSVDGTDWPPEHLVLVRGRPWTSRCASAVVVSLDVPPGTRPSGRVGIG